MTQRAYTVKGYLPTSLDPSSVASNAQPSAATQQPTVSSSCTGADVRQRVLQLFDAFERGDGRGAGELFDPEQTDLEIIRGDLLVPGLERSTIHATTPAQVAGATPPLGRFRYTLVPGAGASDARTQTGGVAGIQLNFEARREGSSTTFFGNGKAVIYCRSGLLSRVLMHVYETPPGP